jgi:hypothetical protein
VISGEALLGLYNQRKRNQGSLIENMRAVRDQYNGDIVIPLPEIDAAERPAVANILNMGLDQTAKRIASTVPDVYYPPMKPGIQKSEDRARVRRRATLGWWEQNRQRLKLRRRARWLIGYSSSPVVMRPDPKREIPQWSIRNPLTAYIAPSEDPDSITPHDAIFTFRRSWQWLTYCYPVEIMGLYTGPQGSVPKQDDLFDLLEYHDATETVLAVVGRQRDQFEQTESWGTCVILERAKNRIGMCPVVAPATINLDRQMGLYDGALGMYMTQAKLMAVSTIGAYKEVLPETWAISRPGENVNIVVQPDPLRGVIGEISGGEIHQVNAQISPQSQQMIDRLERNQRVESGIPPEFGGESGGNIRTGRRGDAVLSATVDFTIQECQEILAASLEEENRRAIAIQRTYWGTKRQSFYVSWDGAAGKVDYVPNEVFEESDRQIVRYSYAGADANNFIIGAGQRVGLGTMSRKTFMEVDPLVPDAEREHDYVVGEALEQSALAVIQQQAEQGAIPLPDLARIWELTTSDKKNLFEAIIKAQEEAQKRQATAGEPGTPEGPVEPGSPEAQPGLAPPGAGAEAGTVAPANPNINNLAMMLQGLNNSGRPPKPQAAPV